ncbi:oxidoreductase domain-containing protein [Myriangium duriaei CBS 260.36]|uniref:Oxidoreductase domain-containing protein n=1 Tax=Myriangium duriaei CBS 260.36 TaxID=1168546 RepID=A0A9P4J111_9PEZI|nr:oxidoreductase domain-containing protein [Myriangium duriaei CBS 260.36]
MTQTKHDSHHDTHALPPMFIQEAYWHYNKVKPADLENDAKVIDFAKGLSEDQARVLRPVGSIKAATIVAACSAFRRAALVEDSKSPFKDLIKDAQIYEHQDFPGLQIIPGLLPPETQILWVSRILHEYLADPLHKINLEADYDIEYPLPPPVQTEEKDSSSATGFARTFFTHEAQSRFCTPKTDAKPLNAVQFLSRKLRWLTLGTQYHWPTRSYPRNPSTIFPPDLSALVTGLFPHITPESGVCLLYGPKDFMPVHRDVSEQCQRALASFSVGCDGIFLVARGVEEAETDAEKATRVVAIRVHSGDCIHLDGETRWAWHAMPRTVAGTCPKYLADWPAGSPGWGKKETKAFEKWKGWMGSKRLNVSCRQVWD